MPSERRGLRRRKPSRTTPGSPMRPEVGAFARRNPDPVLDDQQRGNPLCLFVFNPLRRLGPTGPSDGLDLCDAAQVLDRNVVPQLLDLQRGRAKQLGQAYPQFLSA